MPPTPRSALLMLLVFTTCNFAAPAAGPPPKGDPYFQPTDDKSGPLLPRVIMRNMVQDRAGPVWFATFGGVFRYDGKTFTNLSEEVGLARARGFSVLEDRAGNLWFGTVRRGASRYDGKSATTFTVKDGLVNNDVLCLFEDSAGKIWFGTQGGLSRY